METDYVTGIDVALGGSGDPSPVTAMGTFCGIRAAAQYVWGNDSIAVKSRCTGGLVMLANP